MSDLNKLAKENKEIFVHLVQAEALAKSKAEYEALKAAVGLSAATLDYQEIAKAHFDELFWQETEKILRKEQEYYNNPEYLKRDSMFKSYQEGNFENVSELLDSLPAIKTEYDRLAELGEKAWPHSLVYYLSTQGQVNINVYVLRNEASLPEEHFISYGEGNTNENIQLDLPGGKRVDHILSGLSVEEQKIFAEVKKDTADFRQMLSPEIAKMLVTKDFSPVEWHYFWQTGDRKYSGEVQFNEEKLDYIIDNFWFYNSEGEKVTKNPEIMDDPSKGIVILRDTYRYTSGR